MCSSVRWAFPATTIYVISLDRQMLWENNVRELGIPQRESPPAPNVVAPGLPGRGHARSGRAPCTPHLRHRQRQTSGVQEVTAHIATWRPGCSADVLDRAEQDWPPAGGAAGARCSGCSRRGWLDAQPDEDPPSSKLHKATRPGLLGDTGRPAACLLFGGAMRAMSVAMPCTKHNQLVDLQASADAVLHYITAQRPDRAGSSCVFLLHACACTCTGHACCWTCMFNFHFTYEYSSHLVDQRLASHMVPDADFINDAVEIL